MPLLKLAEILHLKMPQKPLNWLNRDDLINLLELEGYEVIKTGRRFLFPIFIPILSGLINRFLAQLPIINRLCLTTYLIARLPQASKEMSVSIIIPARNEKGNIEQAVKRLPVIGSRTEIIFIEGGSTDGTFEEIERVAGLYPEKNISFGRQEGKGKGDAVRKGFSMATGDILMILDADLTVAPEDLPKFYSTLRADRGEFINGCRLVYPLEKDSMMTLNIFGNKFFSLMFSWLLGQRLKDTLCGTKVLTKENYERLAANRSYFGDFDPFGDFDLIFGAAKLDLKIVEIPIQYHARQYGETNISRFKHGWLLLKMVAFAMNKIKFI
jgi:glycosyltransferase involved in cell wall biosynthesis